MNKQLNILIVEDELLIGEMLKEMLHNQHYNVVGIASSYIEGKILLEEHPETNIVITDINLNNDQSGLEMGQLINTHYHIPFIYLTSYSDPKTLELAAATQPFGYMIKPFKEEEIAATLMMIKSRMNLTPDLITFKHGIDTVKLQINDIRYLQSEGNYILVFTQEKKYLLRTALESFLQEINSSLLRRTHRSFAVNLNHIISIKSQEIKLTDKKIPLSRKYKKEIHDLFISQQ
ncbi:response regulator transcription factor [Lishizhenia sp.]|uniref:LytR/AlgR family response regulator transcription factor n=1 Tax=Lishizhenia sp. TaxID=2497594 RepID=UPI00299E31A2|nr:response regulator transcription factor [Lishizhenia sp.]MDX1447357.1 response regulator transcription factor [Lishizhenia sp.]